MIPRIKGAVFNYAHTWIYIFLLTWFFITSYRIPNFKAAETKYRNWVDGNHIRILKSQVRICNIRRAIVVDFLSSCRVYRKYQKSVYSLDQCFPTCLPWWDPQNNFYVQRKPSLRKRLQVKYRAAVGSTSKLLQNCQLQNKTSLDIWNFRGTHFYVFISRYLAETLIMFCGILGFRYTLLREHWSRI